LAKLGPAPLGSGNIVGQFDAAPHVVEEDIARQFLTVRVCSSFEFEIGYEPSQRYFFSTTPGKLRIAILTISFDVQTFYHAA
jgi:hypothetical protein